MAVDGMHKLDFWDRPDFCTRSITVDCCLWP